MEKLYYLGVDGGATKTTFALADSQGNILRRIQKTSSNPIDLGISKACSILEQGIDEILNGFDHTRVHAYFGLSGGGSGDMLNRIQAFLSRYDFCSCKNGRDADNILAAGIGEGNGIALIMGTGSCAFVQKEREVKRIDGHGYLFSHGGCGYDVGNMAIRAALRSEDGRGKPTKIRELILNKTGHKTVLEGLDYFYAIGKAGIASYAPLVFEAYDAGDEVAAEILQKNMEHVAEILFTGGKILSEERLINVQLVGGLTSRMDVLLPMIIKQLKELDDVDRYALNVFKEDVVKGALLLAGLKKDVVSIHSIQQ